MDKSIIDNTKTKLVDFDDINCLYSALAKIADEFKLEYWIDADQSIHLPKKTIAGKYYTWIWA